MPDKKIAKQSVTTPHRLEAFSDGVMAIIITIMVLRINAPTVPTFDGWYALLPRLVAYTLSFIFIAQYWHSHHQLLRFTKWIGGGVMWANMHLLFWLSLIPVATAWVGENDNYLHTPPVVGYGVVALMASVAYRVVVKFIQRIEPNDVAIARIGKDKKGIVSILMYAVGISVAALGLPLLGIICYVAVSVLWFIPDRRLANVSS